MAVFACHRKSRAEYMPFPSLVRSFSSPYISLVVVEWEEHFSPHLLLLYSLSSFAAWIHVHLELHAVCLCLLLLSYSLVKKKDMRTSRGSDVYLIGSHLVLTCPSTSTGGNKMRATKRVMSSSRIPSCRGIFFYILSLFS